jgi:hypothetical protein
MLLIQRFIKLDKNIDIIRDTILRLGERFGRNITVNQGNWFSMNCLVFVLTWNSF